MATVLFVHTLPAFYIVIFKFGVIFDELNSSFSIFVCFIYVYVHIFDLLLYLLILHPIGFFTLSWIFRMYRENFVIYSIAFVCCDCNRTQRSGSAIYVVRQ